MTHQRADWLEIAHRVIALHREWLDDELRAHEDLKVIDLGTIISWLMVYADAQGLAWDACLAMAETIMDDIRYDDHEEYA